VSVVAIPGRERVGKIRLALSPEAASISIVALVVTALVILTWGTWGELTSDTGYDLVAGSRVAHGQLPYSDFVYFYGPLGPLVLGFAMWVAGVGMGAPVAVGLALAVAIVGATYALGRDIAGPIGGALAAAIVTPLAFDSNNFSYVQPHSYSASLGILLVLIVLLALGRARSGSRSWLVGAGVAAGLVSLTRPEFELAALGGLAVWALVLRRTGGLSRNASLALIAPAVAIPVAVYGAFLTQVSLHSLVFENLYPTKVLRAGGDAVLRLQAPLTPSSFAHLGGRLVLYALGCVALVVVARTLVGRGRLGRIVVGLGACAVLVLAAFRPETARYYLEYAYGWIPAAAVLLLAVVVARRRMRSISARDAALIAVLAILSAKTYNDYVFHAHIPQMAVYSAPFAAVFMVWLHLDRLGSNRSAAVLGGAWLAVLALVGLGLTLDDAGAKSYVVRGSGGSMSVVPGDGRLLQQLVNEIEQRTKPGEQILLAPQLTALYTLTGRTDPLPQISLMPGALPTMSDERAAIARLEHAGVRLVVIDDHSFPEYGQTMFGASFDRTLAAWIFTHYQHAAVLHMGGSAHHIDLFVRRAP
jgi:hypothetical protein